MPFALAAAISSACRFLIFSRFTEKDDDYFTARFTAPARGIKFWALQYLPYVEVTEPEWLREEIIASMKQNMYNVITE